MPSQQSVRAFLVRPIRLSYRANGVLSLLAVGYLGFIAFTMSPSLNDFEFYRRAAQSLLQTGDPYSQHAGYIYPPLLAVFLQPFALLTPEVAQLVWFGVNVVFCGGVLWLSLILIPSQVTRYCWGGVALGFVLFPPVRLTLYLGQISGLIAVLLLATLVLSTSRPGFAGFWLALASCLKLYPAFLGVYFVFHRSRALLWWGVVFGMAITLVVMGVYGVQPYLSYLMQALPHEVIPYAAEFNISIVGFWSRLLTDNQYTIPVAVRPVLAQVLIGLMSLVVLVGCVWGRWQSDDVLGRRLCVSLWLCAMLLLSPVNGYYNLVVLLFPVLTLVRYLEVCSDAQVRGWLLGAIILLCIPPTWTEVHPALVQFCHRGWGVLLLAPSFYGVWMCGVLLVLALYRWGGLRGGAMGEGVCA